MPNEMRDRLYGLLGECEKKYSAYYGEFIKQLDKAETQADFEKIYDGVIKKHDFFADHLIENGVIVPPCKVGDTVYQLDNAGNIYESKIRRIIYDTVGISFDERAIGKGVFLSREKAEQKAKKLGLRKGDCTENLESYYEDGEPCL